MKRLAILFLITLFFSAASSSYLRVPVTFDLFSLITVQVGTPPVQMKLSLFFLNNDLWLYYKNTESIPLDSSSITKVYCNTTDYKCKNQCPISRKKQQCLANQKNDFKIYEDVFGFESGKTMKVNFFGIRRKEEELSNKLPYHGFLGIGPLARGNPLTKWFLSSQDNQNVLSLCLGRSGNGYLQLGSDPEEIQEQKGISFPYSQGYNFYATLFQQMTFDSIILFSQNSDKEQNQQQQNGILAIGSKQAFVSQIYTPIHTKMVKQIKKSCVLNDNCSPSKKQHTLEGCISLKGDNIRTELDKTFGKFSIKIRGERLQWSASQYFVKARDQLCLCFFPTETGAVLLGTFLLRSKKLKVNFDENRIQIFENQACKYVPGKSDNQKSQSVDKQQQTKEVEESNEQNSQIVQQPIVEVPTEKDDGNDDEKNFKNDDKKGQNTKQSDQKTFKILLFAIIILLLLLVCFGGKICQHFQGQMDKLKGSQENELQEQPGDGSEITVK